MIYEVKSVQEYLQAIPQDRVETIQTLRQILKANLPPGFTEEIQYGMIGYVVPLSTYPKGYRCKANTPLPFISISSQKNTINFYHMGIYVKPELLHWFVSSYQRYYSSRLDMGKSCMRFKKAEDIPFDLIAELAQKMTVQEVIALYEQQE